jgi:hypothetical protein
MPKEQRNKPRNKIPIPKAFGDRFLRLYPFPEDRGARPEAFGDVPEGFGDEPERYGPAPLTFRSVIIGFGNKKTNNRHNYWQLLV